MASLNNPSMDMEDEEDCPFVFSNPNVVDEPAPRNSKPEINFFPPPNQPSLFTFSPPSNLSRSVFTKSPQETEKSSTKIPSRSRNLFQPPSSVFSQAVKEAAPKKVTPKSSIKLSINSSITCTNVPKGLLTKSTAKKYFETYGTILKLVVRPRHREILAAFSSKSEATIALNNAGNYEGENFEVSWTSGTPKSATKKKEPKKSSKRSIADDDELKIELDALRNMPNCAYFDEEMSTPTKSTSKGTKKSVKESKVLEKSEFFESTVKTVIPSASAEELRVIIKQQAQNSEDKYRILDARDKLIKLKQSKQVDLTMKITIGTCPDMCPEKERLMRDSQRQVSIFEQVGGQDYRINHEKAIKQYSRSSADQEEPLPHELRPVRSLKMTMSYLLHEIVDLCENPGTNLGDWFHFVWDRTRGIRKDITQQELCCSDSVELIEQCARFHILCSERLCAEDSSVFDKKINTENLTKCLQTLKYMYHDLRLKSITCKNEPEFRAYVILLNLNDGNFMWELQKLPENVQKSPEVKFALKVHSAIAQNNYCTFFKLVRATTYLNAAILLRYFNQVRMKALSIMMKAYCRTPSTTFDLYELIDILGFEDENEAVYFCEQTGLDIAQDTQEEVSIIFNRQKFQLPESNLEQGRSLNIIESKRTRNNISIGECISGGKLPERTYLGHVAHSSFDEHGFLLPRSLNAQDQTLQKDPYEFTEDEEMLDSSKESVGSSPSDVAPSFSFLEEKPEEIPAFSFKENITFKVPHFGTNFASEIKSLDSTEKKSFNLFGDQRKKNFSFGSSKQSSIFQFSKSAEEKVDEEIEKPKEKSKEELEQEERERERLLEEKRLAEEKQKQEERERILAEIDQQSEEIYQDLQKLVVKELSSSILKNEIDILQNQRKLANDVYEALLDEIIEETCLTEYEREMDLHRTLKEMKNRIQRHSIMKCFRIWKKQVQKRKIQLEALNETPVWIQKRSLEECASSLFSPEQDLVLENMRVKRFRTMESETSSVGKRVPLEILAYTAFKQHPKLVRPNPKLDKVLQRVPNLFWKCGVSYPAGEDNVSIWRHELYLKRYLEQTENENPIVRVFRPNTCETFHMSLELSKGQESISGMDGLVFVMSEDEEEAEKRLSNIFYSMKKFSPIPVAVLLLGEDTVRVDRLNLGNFVEAGFVSKVTVFTEKSAEEEKNVRVMQVAVPWLVINRAPRLSLEIDDLKQVLSDCLMEILWLRIGNASSDLENPNLIISLHNEAVNHIINILLDPDTLLCPEFPEEFKIFLRADRQLPYSYEYCDNEWRESTYRQKLEDNLRSLILPTWEHPWPAADVMSLSSSIKLYVKEVLPEVNHNRFSGAILSNLYLILESSIKPSFTYILTYIIQRKINDFGGHTKVVYNKDRMRHFKSVPFFPSNLSLDYSPRLLQIEDEDTTDSENADFDLEDDFHRVEMLSKDLKVRCEQLETSLQEFNKRLMKALEI